MKKTHIPTVAAALAATIVVSLLLSSCQGRKMSNMEPTGETVEVVVNPDTVPAAPAR